MDQCVCCGSSEDLRGVNLHRGCFIICRLCRAAWEEGVTASWRGLVERREAELADARRAIKAALDSGLRREWQAAAGTNSDKENA